MLHKSWMSRASAGRGAVSYALVSHPRYEVEETDYGIRAAALRDIGGGEQYIRTTEYVMPFVSLVPNSGQRTGTMFMAVPIDDQPHMLFWGLWNEDGACADQAAVVCAEPRDMNNYALLDGSKANVWRQDRAAMAEGHFTGFDKCLLDEDMVVQASMGVITDRTKEQLSPSDLGLVRARARLLADLTAFEEGRLAHAQSAIIRPVDCVASQQENWRALGGAAPSVRDKVALTSAG